MMPSHGNAHVVVEQPKQPEGVDQREGHREQHDADLGGNDSSELLKLAEVSSFERGGQPRYDER